MIILFTATLPYLLWYIHIFSGRAHMRIYRTLACVYTLPTWRGINIYIEV